jgi:putative transcriptional regulator
MQYVGKFLVAPPGQKDPYWRHTVIWIYEWDLGKHAGIIINKTANTPLKALAEHHNIRWSGRDPLRVGGPVNPQAMILAHTPEWHCVNTMCPSDHVHITSSNIMLNRLAQNDSPGHWKMFLGMCAWMPGQLEAELDRSTGWLITDYSDDIFWQESDEACWSHALQRASAEAVDKMFEIR